MTTKPTHSITAETPHVSTRRLKISLLPLSHRDEAEMGGTTPRPGPRGGGGGGGGEKVVHFVRHGQGEHNLRCETAGDCSGYEMEEYRDAPLTALGHQQAMHAAKRILDLAISTTASPRDGDEARVQLVVSSPLTRAIQTALPTYHQLKDHGVGFVIHEGTREGMTEGVHPCNARKSKSALLKEYHFVREFVHVSSHHETLDHDPIWHESYVESQDELRARARGFLQWLTTREERNVAVFAHCVFFYVLFTPHVVDELHPALPRAPEFENGEVKSVILRWEEEQ